MSYSSPTPANPKININPAVVIIRSSKKYKFGLVFQTPDARSLIDNGQARLATPRDAAVAGKTFPPEAFVLPAPPEGAAGKPPKK